MILLNLLFYYSKLQLTLIKLVFLNWNDNKYLNHTTKQNNIIRGGSVRDTDRTEQEVAAAEGVLV